MAFSKKYASSATASSAPTRSISAKRGKIPSVVEPRQIHTNLQQPQRQCKDSKVECCGINPYALFVRASVRKYSSDVDDLPLSHNLTVGQSPFYVNAVFTSDGKSFCGMPVTTNDSADRPVTSTTRNIGVIASSIPPADADDFIDEGKTRSEFITFSNTLNDGFAGQSGGVRSESQMTPHKVTSLRRQEHVVRRKSTEQSMATVSVARQPSHRRCKIWDRADVEDIVESVVEAALARFLTNDSSVLFNMNEFESRLTDRFNELQQQINTLSEHNQSCPEVSD